MNDFQNKAAEKLTAKRATFPCPRCGNAKFILAETMVSLPLQPNTNAFHIGGPVIPVVPVVCDNCGWVSLHSLFALGFTEDELRK